MRSLGLLLVTGLLVSCSVGSDLSRTTFQKKRYSRGYYVHHAQDRSVPDGLPGTATAEDDSPATKTPSMVEVAPPEMAVNTEPKPIQVPRRDGALPPSLSVPIPAREVAGMAHKERFLLLLEAEHNEEQSERKPVHWTTIANLFTLIGGTVGSLFNSPWVLLGLAAPLFAAISFAFAGPRRRHSGKGVAPDAFNGVDMKADPEPELKWHRTTWISLAMIATSLALMVSGASGLFLLSLPALAWFPATYALLKSNAERSHSGRGINRILFFSTLAWFVLYLAFILPWWGNWPYFGWQ